MSKRITSFPAILAANRKLNAFTSIRKPKSIAPRETTGPLAQTSYSIKDLFSTRQDPTTCSSHTLQHYQAPFDATVVELLDSAGASLVGKTNMDEFGMGNTTTHSVFGPSINPQYVADTDVAAYEETADHFIAKPTHTENGESRVSGGSSGGSAVSVASGMVDFSIGSDTGGSTRLPAAYCSIYGFKPTYGRISRWGMIPYAQSLDTVGIMANDVGTLWKVLSILDVVDEKDPTTLSEDLREQISAEWLKQTWVEPKHTMKIGIAEEFLLEETNEEVRSSLVEFLDRIRELGHEIVPISVPSIKQSLSVYYTLVTAEAASNLARYDGNRYGTKYHNGLQTRSKTFGDEVQKRIILGNFTLSSYGYQSYYMKAKLMRGQLIEELNRVFCDAHVLTKTAGNADGGVDFIIAPTSTSVAPRLSECASQKSSVDGYVDDVMTVPGSLAGLPVANVPFQGYGFQIMGQHGMDYKVLQFAASLEEMLSRH